MGWQDRSYYRDRSPGSGNPLLWIFMGSVSVGRWFGIEVKIHASLIVFVGFTLLSSGSIGGLTAAATASAILFGSVLLHEFGHCLASRAVGGNPTEIMMTPLGGLAFADCPRRPWATFITVACGPLVNVAICLITATLLSIMAHDVLIPWHLWDIVFGKLYASSFAFYLWWIFFVNYRLLLFNLLPIFPLDGGQLLQSLLWLKQGYYKATLFSCVTGMIGAILLGIYGLTHFSILLLCIAVMGYLYCRQLRGQLKADGPWAYEEEEIYSAAYENPDRPRKKSARKVRAAQRQAREAAAEQDQIDTILAKVHACGMQSLTWLEKRALKRATEKQRRRSGAQ